MKKGGLPAASLPTHPHSAMDTATKALLRNAVLEAVNNQQDTAAIELLGFLTKEAPTSEPVQSHSNSNSAQLSLQIINGPARSYHYWANFICELFIPFLTANGRPGFTSSELFSWIENNAGAQMTVGDIAMRDDGKPYWRNIVTDALRSLKECGVIYAEKGSRSYAISQFDSEKNNA